MFMWNMYGLEAVKAITEYEKLDQENMVRILKGEKPLPNHLNSLLRAWVIRSRMNPERQYEVWCVDCDDSITEYDWRRMFDDNPQACAELIRKNGICQFNGRGSKDKVVIT